MCSPVVLAKIVWYPIELFPKFSYERGRSDRDDEAAATALGLARGREQGQSFLRVHYCFRGLHVDRLMYFQGVRDRLSTLQGLQVLLRALS